MYTGLVIFFNNLKDMKFYNHAPKKRTKEMDIFPVVMYGCESRAVEYRKNIDTF